MWNCLDGDANMIAGSLTFCPMCGKERDMPRSVVGAVPSHAGAQEGEVGYIAPEEPETEADEKTEPVIDEQLDAQAKVDAEQVETPKVEEKPSAPVETASPSPSTSAPTTPAA